MMMMMMKEQQSVVRGIDNKLSLQDTSSLVNVGGKRFRNLTHTGKRVSKIRWLGAGNQLALPNYNATEYFVTGTWGEQAENEICLWRLSIDFQEETFDRIPQIDKIFPFQVIGNVSDIVALGEDKFAFTTSKGVLAIFKVLEDSDENGFSSPSAVHPACASQLHTYKKTNQQCPATGITTNLESVVTVGEDGSIYEVSLGSFEVSQSYVSVDPLSITTVEFIGRQEIVTGNSGGQVKLYDLRSNNKSASRTLYDLKELSGVKSLAQHPTQNHLLLIGYESGQMELQDLRQNSAVIGAGCEPIAYLPNQNSGVSEIQFHHVNPDHFFTCSQNGEVVHWEPGEPSIDEFGSPDQLNRIANPTAATDLNLEFLKYGFTSKVLYSSPFPLNSMSLSTHNRLICGGDSGLVFCTDLCHV